MAYRIEDIDPNFPVAGVDNDSQGFRDNFSAISETLTTAQSDITDLKESSFNVLDEETDLNTSTIFNGNLRACTATVYAGAPINNEQATTQNVSFTQASYHVIEIGEEIDTTFNLRLADWGPTGSLSSLIIELAPTSTREDPCTITFDSEDAETIYYDATWYPGGTFTDVELTNSNERTLIEFCRHGTSILAKNLGTFVDPEAE